MSRLWEWPGSRWWRVDLHTHTPASHDFSPPADWESPGWTRWVEAARDTGLDAIAITDHNTAAAIKELQQVSGSVDNAPILFPAVELTASDGTHLLLLMDPSCSYQHIEDLLSRVGVPVEMRGQQDARSSHSIEQILRECGNDTLIVGAHVNGPSGLLELEGQQRLAVLKNRNLAGVEVDPNKAIEDHWLDGSLPEIQRKLPQVWCSDGHSPDSLARRFTWIKMTKPELEGLRLALLDGPASLKPVHLETPGNPNEHANLAIESITVVNGKFIGRKSPMEVRFNPWLNAIIGGRGTGKSTLVDFCRKTLRRDSELDSSEHGEEGSLRTLFDRRMRIPPSRLEEGLLTANTSIRLIYRKDGERFVLSWQQHAATPSVARLDGDELIPEEGDIRERFPVRLYGQKQLFALAQDPNALLTVIDDSQSVRKADLERQIRQLRDRYLSLRAEARAAAHQAAELPGREANLADIRHKMDILEKVGQAQILNNYRRLRQLDDTWKAIRQTTNQAIESLELSAAELSVADFDLRLVTEDDPSGESLRRMHDTLKGSVEGLSSNVRERIGQAKQEIASIERSTEAAEWHSELAAREQDFVEASVQLAEEGISDPNEYQELLERAGDLEREIAALRRQRDRVNELQLEAQAVLVNYREKRTELSKRRISFADENSNQAIQVEVDSFSNRERLSEFLVATLGIERFESDRQAIAKRIKPEKSKPWTWEILDKVVAEARDFISGESNHWPAKDHRFQSTLKSIPLERIDSLALYLPEDAVKVSFKDPNQTGSNWKPLTQGSPGQQTAALLAFVLGYGSEPIILDQPEDDLDNTLIYELLVSRLRETKINRQIIVVTHNPNIVVHGDAEFVLSLEAGHGQSRIVCNGGLQEQKVRDEICRVMEGGREAFENRYNRIIPPKSSAQ